MVRIIKIPVSYTHLADIKEELTEQGYIKWKKSSKNEKQGRKKSKPLHYLSSDGYHIYVGKNNKQNDELTLKIAAPNDIWLHSKNIPGSHVIIQTNGTGQTSNDTLLEAAALAAWNSKAKASSQVPIDYTLKRNVKKPNGAKPGMVIYETNKTIYITPEEKLIQNITVIEK